MTVAECGANAESLPAPRISEEAEQLVGKVALIAAEPAPMPLPATTRPNNNRLLLYGVRVFPDSTPPATESDGERLGEILRRMRAEDNDISEPVTVPCRHSLIFSMIQRDKS